MEEVHAPLGVEVVQHVLDPERYVGVAGVVEGGKHHGRVLVILEHFVKGSPPFLQLLKSAEEAKREMEEAEREGLIEREREDWFLAQSSIYSTSQ